MEKHAANFAAQTLVTKYPKVIADGSNNMVMNHQLKVAWFLLIVLSIFQEYSAKLAAKILRVSGYVQDAKRKRVANDIQKIQKKYQSAETVTSEDAAELNR